MPFTIVPIPAVTDGAVSPVGADASNGNRYKNDGPERRLLLINGAPAQNFTIEFNIPESADERLAHGNVIADKSVSISSSQLYYLIGDLPKEVYNQTTGTDKGYVTFTFTGTVTNVTLLVV